MITKLEELVFRQRSWILLVLGLLTLGTGWLATGIRLDTAFEKHLPVGHACDQAPSVRRL